MTASPPPVTDRLPAQRRDRSRYDARRHLLIERGQWRPFTNAAPVRAHVRALMTAGISRGQISVQSGVSDSVLCRLLYGEPSCGRPPAGRIRPLLATRILAVTSDPDRAVGPALVAATATTRRLQALTAQGWAPRELAARLRMDTGGVRKARDGDRARVEAATAQAVAALYDELWDQAPPERTTPERIAAAKARAYAGRRGWVPPMAWDDDAIAGPAARPAPGWRPTRTTRRAPELAEDAAELTARGYTREQAAARLGLSRQPLEQALTRVRQSGSSGGVAV